jgi:hypothetical protein
MLTLGCNFVGLTKSLTTEPLNIKTVSIISTADANDDFPIPVDIVIAKRDDFIEVLAQMDAPTWFDQKEFFLPSNAANIEVLEFELVAGTSSEPVEFDWADRRDARAVFLFARYIQDGSHKLRVDQIPGPIVILGRSSMSILKNAAEN